MEGGWSDAGHSRCILIGFGSEQTPAEVVEVDAPPRCALTKRAQVPACGLEIEDDHGECTRSRSSWPRRLAVGRRDAWQL